MSRVIRIGTRESQLALWQANTVKRQLEAHGHATELVLIKSEGDVDLTTPLYELGVQGIFTKALDIALLDERIDIAVHSMKDVPTQPAKGIVGAAVLKRASHKDILVPKDGFDPERAQDHQVIIATSSIRRKAQWLNRFPNHNITSLRGNVNTRLQKLNSENWDGAIFAAAGLERIDLRPENAIELNWMLPAPAQGAIIVVCREYDEYCRKACAALDDEATAICTKIERDFLRELMGGCSTPISALAEVKKDMLVFKGSILSKDGRDKAEIQKEVSLTGIEGLGVRAAQEILEAGGNEILAKMRNEQ